MPPLDHATARHQLQLAALRFVDAARRVSSDSAAFTEASDALEAAAVTYARTPLVAEGESACCPTCGEPGAHQHGDPACWP